jgi:predicted DNA-binding transcriptional regulator AlpA
MKLRPTQFGMRENTASPRQHASRLSVNSNSNAICIDEERPETQRPSPQDGCSSAGFANELNAAPNREATNGRKEERGQLLTVHEVAQLLHVPASWVYERTRRRSSDQLPCVKLGKYLRFEQATITEFIQRQRCA